MLTRLQGYSTPLERPDKCESCSVKVEWSVKLPIWMLKVDVTRIPYASVENQSPLLITLCTL
jgi:hypothetical protein